MKKLLSIILLIGGMMTTYAQKFEPNTKWPYVYENFTDGIIYFDGNKKTEAKLNIHLWGNKLHYLSDDQRIFLSSDKGVVRVEIGSDAYIYSDHQLVKILAVEQNNLVVELEKGDFDALFAGTGAYGSSLNSSSSQDLSSLDLGGMDTPELGKMLQERHDGRTISLKQQFYFIIDGKQVSANKKSVESILNPNGQKEWKTFLKENKISWKKEESLKIVLSFICQYR